MYSWIDIYTPITLSVLTYMVAWFVLAVMLKRRDVIDSAWGLGFILVASVAYSLRNTDHILTHVSLVLVSLWGIRLFAHITKRNWKKKEDFRYAQMGTLSSTRFWLKTFLSVFVVQGILMILISSPIIAIMLSVHTPQTLVAFIGCVIWFAGILTEAVADYQLSKFIQQGKKGIMQSGLWKYSRHPNYFGEITSWWGAGIVAISFNEWWGIIGSFTITILILKISGIPLLEKRYAKNAEYQKYAKNTSILLPLPVKNHE